MDGPYAIVRDGDRFLAAHDPREVVIADGDEAFRALDHIARGGFWAGYCSYDLGRAIERVEPRTAADVPLPDLAFVRYGHTREIEIGGTAPVALGAGTSSLAEREHAARVDDVHALLRAGECYQVNLTRRITFDTSPDPHALFCAIASSRPAPHAMLCSFGDALPGLAIVSASPELFLRINGREVETRPIKGTAADVHALAASAKDHAEHVMIVDLARNDLGRVCEPGTVCVRELATIESRPGLHHMVSSITGRLRDDASLADLLRATFPPASVTGAPKPRVLQAIEDLEPVRRGAYCGAVGWIDADRARAELAVAIRTFTLWGGRTMLGVGGGIVIDSVASTEWAETELKAARLLAAAGAFEAEPVTAR